MKKLLLFLFQLVLIFNLTNGQNIITEQTQQPILIKVKSHDSHFNKFPEKSFYKSKEDWQTIIDTTWGPGLPLASKKEIFNAYVSSVEDKFDGFLSLGFTAASWDSLKNHYYSKIDSSTSRGRFSAIMYYFAMNLHDGHTWAYDKILEQTPLNPGTPILVFGNLCTNQHFGAVTTVLEDSTALVLRTVDNHPLNLEPGDIILGYEGIPWKTLVQELMDAEIPVLGIRQDRGGLGGTSASQSSSACAIHVTVGMNWHLFDSIDILKYSTGDTLHLSVLPLIFLNLPYMLNNEQLAITNISFPDYFNDEVVSYGILPNTNIGYVYVYSEWFPSIAGADQQFYEAISSLQFTDGIIIDMRWNEGGASAWFDSFAILSNEVTYTIDDAYRCSPFDWSLCPANTYDLFRISGVPPDQYERPIAVLLGPGCFSMGDVNANRLAYLSTVRTFGKSTAANLGLSDWITSFPDWSIRHSKTDMYHLNEPNVYLNRKEFPIDFPVWHNKDDAAQGKDAVVEVALDWMNNLEYTHDLSLEKEYFEPNVDSVFISLEVENPNSSQIISTIYFENLIDGSIDSTSLSYSSGEKINEIWIGQWLPPIEETFYKINSKTTNSSSEEIFTISNMARITTAGPIVIESLSITYNSVFDMYKITPTLKNEGQSFTVENLTIDISSSDTSLSFLSASLPLSSIGPGEIIQVPGTYTVKADSNFAGIFNLNLEIKCDGWLFWRDSVSKPLVSVECENQNIPQEYSLMQNFPNPFNPTTLIKYQIPKRSFVTLKLFDVLGSEVSTIVNEEKPVGNYEVGFNGTNLPSGVYFYKLTAGYFSETKKMLLIK